MKLLSLLRVASPMLVALAVLLLFVPSVNGGGALCLNGKENPISCDPDCDGVCKICGAVSSGSIIMNGNLEYIHDALDFLAAPGAEGCAECGLGNASEGQLPSLEVRRRYYSRISSGGKKFFSFGKSSYWKNYDNQLRFVDVGEIHFFDTSQFNTTLKLTFDLTRGAWIEQGDEQIWGLFLFDDQDLPVVSEANRDTARTGTLIRNNGYSEHYEFIEDDGGDIRARLTTLMDRNGNAIEFDYILAQPTAVVPVGDAHQYWQRSKVRDAYGREISLTYTQFADFSFITAMQLPNGEQISYEYGNWVGVGKRRLTRVNYPDGSESTFSCQKLQNEGLIQITFFDAGAEGTKRRKKVFQTPPTRFTPMAPRSPR